VKATGTPRELFANRTDMSSFGLDLPETIKFQQTVEKKLGITFPRPLLTMDEMAEALTALYQEDTTS